MEENGSIVFENIVGEKSYTMLYKPVLKLNIIIFLLFE